MPRGLANSKITRRGEQFQALLEVRQARMRCDEADELALKTRRQLGRTVTRARKAGLSMRELSIAAGRHRNDLYRYIKLGKQHR